MIVHLDGDAFYASVEQAADSRLRGKPVAIGGEKRGIIASASYEARKLGIYTPMPSAKARKLCPKLILLPGDFELYERFSRFMFSYAHDFTPNVEVTSIDEGYFDLGGYHKKPPREVAEVIRKAISQRLKITVSEGIASNKLTSQIASKLRKPANLIEVPAGHEREFLAPLPNHWLPNVGPKLSATLSAGGLAFIRQIAEMPLDLLAMLAGNYARQLRQFAMGIDDRPLVLDRPSAQTYGTQKTFGEDVTSESTLVLELHQMADALTARVREDGKSFRTVTVTLRYNDMLDTRRSLSLPEPTDLADDIYPLLRPLLKSAWERRVSARLVGLRLSGIHGAVFRSSLPLDAEEPKRRKMQQLAPVFDALRQEGKIMRGHELFTKPRPQAALAKRAEYKAPAIFVPKLPRIQPQALNVKSYFSFLDSTLSPAAIAAVAKQHGCTAVAITDPNLQGAVPFYQAVREAGLKPIIGCELQTPNGPRLAYAQNKAGYENLCQLLSFPILTAEHLREFSGGVVSPAHHTHALPEIRYAAPADRHKHNIMQSIRTLTRLNQPHPEKRTKAYHFPTPEEWAAFSEWQLAATARLADECEFQFEESILRFPRYVPNDGSTPHAFLHSLAWQGLRNRYGAKAYLHEAQLNEELGMISEVGYEEYFLVVWDLLQQCRQLGIDWITRGSAADSLVCYCLGISGVCPIRFDLYFRRFLNRERMLQSKLPDIDIDFPHDRRDEVADLLFKTYGNAHVACVGGFSTFQGRSAVAEIAKVLGVSESQIRRMTEQMPHTNATHVHDAVSQSQECRDSEWTEEPYKTALEMASFLDGFPRYPKMHPCGLVVSRDPIHSLTPTFTSNKGYPTTHADMDAVEDLGLIKLDILAQGGLAAMRDCMASLRKRGIEVDLASLEPWEDPEVWELITSGGARAVHHIESPAMISLCTMTNVREIDGLIAIVSVIRPGAANESKKLKFTRRYQGLEPIYYPHPCLEPCLKSTFGLVVYEEHILQISEAFAGLPPGRADMLRRALNKRKDKLIAEIMLEFVASAAARGHSPEKIAEVWELVSGFNGYAFCKAHSTAYGVEAYQAAHLKRYYPAEFMAAVLTNGKGFYSPLVYVLECHLLGIGFLPPSVNQATPAYEVEGGKIRVPLARMKGLTAATLERMLKQRSIRPFASIREFCERVRPNSDELENIIRIGGFDEFGFPRTHQFWQAKAYSAAGAGIDGQGWLLPPPDVAQRLNVPLHEPTLKEKLEWESDLYGFTISGHPLDLYPDVAWDTYCPVSRLGEFIGQRVVMCGLVIEQRMHHQVTGEVMKFLSIADKTGIVATELFAGTYRSYGTVTVRYSVLEVEGTVEQFDNGRGVSLRVWRVSKPRLLKLTASQ